MWSRHFCTRFISTITFVAKLQKPIKLNFAQFQAEDKSAKNSVAAQNFIGAHSHSSCRESKPGHLAIYDKRITTRSHNHWWQVVPKYLIAHPVMLSIFSGSSAAGTIWDLTFWLMMQRHWHKSLVSLCCRPQEVQKCYQVGYLDGVEGNWAGITEPSEATCQIEVHTN